MHPTVEPVARLVEEFARLPGIGPKTAQRLTFYLLRMPPEHARALAEAILHMKEAVHLCSVCANITDADPCPICRSETRDHATICVVEEPLDILALERTREFKGVYHVLHGALSPLENIGPEHLKIQELLRRLGDGTVREVIVATNATVDGQTTAHYLAERLANTQVPLTRLAHGVPVGGELDWLDDGTLATALKARRAL